MFTYLTALSTAPVANADNLWTVSGLFVAAALACTVWHFVNPKVQLLGIAVLCLCVALLVQILPKG